MPATLTVRVNTTLPVQEVETTVVVGRCFNGLCRNQKMVMRGDPEACKRHFIALHKGRCDMGPIAFWGPSQKDMEREIVNVGAS